MNKKIIFISSHFDLAMISLIHKFLDKRELAIFNVNSEFNFNISSKIDFKDIKGDEKTIISKIFNETNKNDILLFYKDCFNIKDRRTIFYVDEPLKGLFAKKPSRYVFQSNVAYNLYSKKYKGSMQLYMPLIYSPKRDTLPKNKTICCIYKEQTWPFVVDAITNLINDERKPEEPTFNLVVAGKEVEIKDERMKKITTFVDSIDQAFSSADVFIHMEKDVTFDHMILDAASQSIVTVSLPFKNVSEIIRDTETGFISSENVSLFASLVKDTITDVRKLPKLKDNAYQFSLKFTDDIILPKWEELFNLEDTSLVK